ncbi:hypothetical protein PYCC9005_005767 [Savitreella phatthalungensis]
MDKWVTVTKPGVGGGVTPSLKRKAPGDEADAYRDLRRGGGGGRGAESSREVMRAQRVPTKAPVAPSRSSIGQRPGANELAHIMHVATVPSTRGHDIWQSASTGHQVSEQGGRSTSYNEARLAKLKVQFPTANGGKSSTTTTTQHRSSEHIELFHYTQHDNTYYPVKIDADVPEAKGIFAGCTFYLDGYMGGGCSDHSLKRLLTQNGGQLSLYMQKSRITHVVLSEDGALATQKRRKECESTLRGNRVKFVTVRWCHDSLEKGKRQPEWKYAGMMQAGQRSVGNMLEKQVKENEDS